MNGKTSRRKGHNFEREIANRFKPIYPNAQRLLEYQQGEGKDIQGVPWRIQCKCRTNPNVWEALKEAEESVGIGFPVAVVKRTQIKGRPVKTVAVMDFDDWLELVSSLKTMLENKIKTETDDDEQKGRDG